MMVSWLLGHNLSLEIRIEWVRPDRLERETATITGRGEALELHFVEGVIKMLQ